MRSSVAFRRVRVNSYSTVENCVLFDNVTNGRNCHIVNTIIDKNVQVPDGTRIGFDPIEDKLRGFTVMPSGIVTVPKSYVFR